MNKKYDWDAIERQYVSGTMGLRELARINGIENHSLVMAQSRRRGWAKKRAEFEDRADSRTVVLMADREAARRAREVAVRDNAIDAIDEAITTLRSQMKKTRTVFRNGEYVQEPLVIMRPQDLALLIDRLNVLFGRPSNITEERSLGISLAARGAGPDLLRGIVEATRGVSDAGSSASSPIPRIGGAREN